MEISKYIFMIESETNCSCLIRIISLFNRRKVVITDLQSSLVGESNIQRTSLTVEETMDNAELITKKLEREVDVLTVNIFKQANQNWKS